MEGIVNYERYRMIDEKENKLCLICSEYYLLNKENFYKNKTSPDGFNPYCKPCTRKKSRQWEIDNPEKYRALNKKKIESRDPKRLQRSREAARKNREEGYQKKWRQENRNKLKEYNYNHMHKQHDITDEEWVACLNYFNDSCAYCNINQDEAKEQQGHSLHMEHAINNGANDLSNCIPSCRSCNSQKWVRDYTEWYVDGIPQFKLNNLIKIVNWLDKEYKKYI